MSLRVCFYFSLLCLLAFKTATCQDQMASPKVEPVVVTVSGEEVPLAQAPASVTVISREQIESSHAATVSELLKQTPFLHISQVGPLGGLSTVTLRGGDPNFTLVMIDGVPLNNPTNLLGGSFDFSMLSTDNIERIEIVRGPLSSLFGSEAMSGVINIISKRGSGKTDHRMQGEFGNFKSRQVQAGTSGRGSHYDYSLSGSYLDIGKQVLNDSYQLGTIALTGGFRIDDANQINFSSRYQDKDSSGFPENGGGPLFSILKDPKQVSAREVIISSGYSKDFKTNWNVSTLFDYFKHLENSDGPAILDGNPPGPTSQPALSDNLDFSRLRANVETSLKYDPVTAIFGLGLKEERGQSNALIEHQFPAEFEIDRTTRSVSSEFLFERKNVNGAVGSRWDDADGFPLEWSPRLGISYLFPATATRLKSSWGQAFKLPSFFALAEPNVGNPNLKPERTRGFDFSIEQQAGIFLNSVTYFYNTYNDLIDFSTQEFRLVNRSSAISRGVELETHAQVDHAFDIGGYLSYVNERLLGTEERLRDRPRWRGGMNAGWQNRVTHFRIDFVSVGERFDFQIPVPDRTIAPGYRTVDVSFDRTLNKDFTVYARFDNLLNNQFQEFIGFPNAGRYARFGVRLHIERSK